MHEGVSLVAGPRSGTEEPWQGYCKGLWRRRCAQGRLPHAAARNWWCEPGCSPAAGTRHRARTVTQGSPQQWFNSGGDIASEALDGFLTITEGSILIFRHLHYDRRYLFTTCLRVPVVSLAKLKQKEKKGHCNITAYIGKRYSALTLQPQHQQLFQDWSTDVSPKCLGWELPEVTL